MKDMSIGIIPFFLEQDGVHKFLLVRHAQGHWGFPKGHPIDNETEIATARRELEEETGIKQFDIMEGFKQTSNYSFQRGKDTVDKVVIFFLGQISEKTLTRQEAEISDIGLFTYEIARTTLTYPDSITLLDKARHFLNKK